METQRLLRAKDASEYLRRQYQIQILPATLTKQRQRGRGPVYLRVSGRIYYRTADLDSYVLGSVVDPAAQRSKAGVRRSRGTRRASR